MASVTEALTGTHTQQHLNSPKVLWEEGALVTPVAAERLLISELLSEECKLFPKLIACSNALITSHSAEALHNSNARPHRKSVVS